MQKHFTLRSKVHIDLSQPERYFWQELPDPSTAEQTDLPLEFKTLNCADSDLTDELEVLDSVHHGQILKLDEHHPFRLYCINWQNSVTHLQLVTSHVAFDGVSLGIFFDDLFSYYNALTRGESPTVESLPYSVDWSQMWGVSISAHEKYTMQKPVLTQYRLQKNRSFEQHFDERDWQALFTRTENMRNRKLKQLSTMDQSTGPLIVFPRLVPEDQLASVNPHTEPIALKYAEFTEEQSEGLRRYARRFNATLHEILNLAYLKCQLDIAQQRGEPFRTIRLLYSLSSRNLCQDPVAEQAIGNFIAFQDSTLAYSGRQDDLPTLLSKIKVHDLTNDALHPLLKGWLLKAAIHEAVKADDWKTYLSLFFNQTQQYFRNTTSLMTASMGVFERSVRTGKLEVKSIRSIPLTRRYYVGIGMFKKRVTLIAGYIPALLVARDVEEVWHRTHSYLLAFSNSTLR